MSGYSFKWALETLLFLNFKGSAKKQAGKFAFFAQSEEIGLIFRRLVISDVLVELIIFLVPGL